MNDVEHQLLESVSRLVSYFNHVAIVAGVLAGFGFQAMVEFVRKDETESLKQNILTKFLIAILAISSTAMITALAACFAGWLAADFVHNSPDYPDEFMSSLVKLKGLASMCILVGGFTLLLGIAITGWLRSVWLGVITCAIAMTAGFPLSYGFYYLTEAIRTS